jgi:hypothetical protein
MSTSGIRPVASAAKARSRPAATVRWEQVGLHPQQDGANVKVPVAGERWETVDPDWLRQV